MDEPTASISGSGGGALFAVVEDLEIRGVAMMFVGHRMDDLADRRQDHRPAGRTIDPVSPPP